MGMSENDKKKEYLRGYRDSVYQISRIQAEIDEVRELKASVPSCGTGKNRKSWKEDLSKRMSQLSTMEDKLKAEKEKRVRLYMEIMQAVNLVSDSRERDVLFYKYIKGLTLWEISGKMGYSERSVQRLHGQALLHFKIKDVV